MTTTGGNSERFSDVGLLVSDGARIVALKPSETYPEVLRVCSAPVDGFDLTEVSNFIGFDSARDGWVLLFSSQDALDLLRRIITPASFTVATKAPKNVQSVIAAHLKLHGTLQEYCAVTPGRQLPTHIQRLYDRVGPDGHLLIGAAMTFGQGRSAFRLAARSYLSHRELEKSRRTNDELVGQMLAWNVLSQSYIALENFCAMLHALGSARSAPKTFATEYLKFGRAESDLHGPNVTSVMNQILGRHGPDMIATALGIPLRAEDLAATGLDDCGIEAQKLIDSGRRSRDILVERFRELALFVIQGRTTAGGAVKSVPAKAYGAFRHGFAAGFPLHLPNGVIMHGNPERFKDERDFLEYESQVNYKAEIMYLGDPDAAGNRKIETVRPVVYSNELKAFVRATYWASWWTLEMAKYARSLFGSVDARFPYLINSVQILGERARKTLQSRLDELEGCKIHEN